MQIHTFTQVQTHTGQKNLHICAIMSLLLSFTHQEFCFLCQCCMFLSICVIYTPSTVMNDNNVYRVLFMCSVYQFWKLFGCFPALMRQRQQSDEEMRGDEDTTVQHAYYSVYFWLQEVGAPGQIIILHIKQRTVICTIWFLHGSNKQDITRYL